MHDICNYKMCDTSHETWFWNNNDTFYAKLWMRNICELMQTWTTVNSTSSPTLISWSTSKTSLKWKKRRVSLSVQRRKPNPSFSAATTPCSRRSPDTKNDSSSKEILVARRSWSRRSVATWNCTQSPCLFQNSKLHFSANCIQMQICFKMLHTQFNNNCKQVDSMHITHCNGQAWPERYQCPGQVNNLAFITTYILYDFLA